MLLLNVSLLLFVIIALFEQLPQVRSRNLCLSTSFLGLGLLVVTGSLCGLSGGLGLGEDLTHLGGLAGNTLLLADSVLGATSLLLGLELLIVKLLSLHFVDFLDQNVLVLELVTLGGQVELVVDVLVDLLGFTVALEQPTEDTGATHGEDYGRHTGVLGSPAVTGAVVASSALLSLVALDTGARVHGARAADNDTILVQFADVLAGVGKGDFAGFVGVNPHALAAAFKHGGGEPPLQSH